MQNLAAERSEASLSIIVTSQSRFSDSSVRLSTNQRKTAYILRNSIESISERHSISHIGFLTLTFAEHIVCAKAAQRRLNSLLSHVIKQRYKEYVGVFERQKSGRIHYHLLVVLKDDIRSGVNFDELQDGKYRSANKCLRSEWSFWRKTSKKYGFGRTELLPVKSNVQAMAKYVGKYISKHIHNRADEDKNIRLVRYSRNARCGTTKFSFNSNGAKEWRRKLAVFKIVVESHHDDIQINDISDYSKILGPRWAYKCREFILSIP